MNNIQYKPVSSRECKITVDVRKKSRYCRVTAQYKGFSGFSKYAPTVDGWMPADKEQLRASPLFEIIVKEAVKDLNDIRQMTARKLNKVKVGN